MTRMNGRKACRNASEAGSAQVIECLQNHSSGDHRDSDYGNHVAMAMASSVQFSLVSLPQTSRPNLCVEICMAQSLAVARVMRAENKNKKLVNVHMNIDALAVLTVGCALSSHTGEIAALQVELGVELVAWANKRVPCVIV